MQPQGDYPVKGVSGMVAAALAPCGVLRAAVNVANSVLCQVQPDGEVQGIAALMANTLASRMGVPVEIVCFDGARTIVEAARKDTWDIAFLAFDSARQHDIAFTRPYVLVEATCLVRADSPLRDIGEIDTAGLQIAVGRGGAYELHLSRLLRNATAVRADSYAEALVYFLRDGLDALAGVRQPLFDFTAANPGYRLLNGNFATIGQAIGVPSAAKEAVPFLQDFVEEAIATGLVRYALDVTKQTDATIPAVACGVSR